ncbi:ESCRT-I component [Histoplasma capsulatum G186AR]|uniref:ESCRT-I component n=1 Tax=Ajellomyces capsulatus TaxID=5037 RepID=A0A8H7YPP4_AJECA|nr:ESCRT-I component [Histoplasma capsulatum]QSS75400.1 ESCRT-I component [Histoplasma capsulatum G186AR]
MAVVPQKTLTWLYRVLTNPEYGPNQAYRDPNRTYNDVTNLLAQYPGFVLRTDVYTYENGTPALLLQLAGTLPVTFRGALYRFPITIWVPKAYPREPPFVYVTPTQDMLVRPGQHVSGEGRVYHHYLAHWSEASDRSTIVDLLYILRDVFAKEPPVISKQQQNIRISAQQNEPPPPVPPLPQELAKTVSPSPPPAQLHQAPPQLPPKPSQVVEPERQQQEHPAQAKYNKPPPPLPPLPNDIGHQRSVSQQRNYDQVSNNHDTYRAPQRSSSLRQPTPQSQMAPQTPPLPQKQGYQQDGYRPTHMGPVSPVPGSNMITPPHIPQAFSHQHQQQPYPPQGPHLQPQIHPAPQTQPLSRPLHVPPYGPPPMSHHTLGSQQPAPPEKKNESRDPLNSLFELELPSLSSPQIAPPIPPNPEKDALLRSLSESLTQTLQSIISQTASNLQPLQSQSQALHAAITTLQSEIASLNSFHSTLQSNTSILQQSLQRADGVIADAKSRISTGLSTNVSSTEPSSSSTAATERQTTTGLPAIDDVLVAPTVVGKQIYDLVAEERGIQRAIYALQAGLVKGRVSVETWARLTRGLAREAFLKKALVRKAGLGLGLVVEGDGE